jgi:tetratricopeptide (TPR) repeat protein
MAVFQVIFGLTVFGLTRQYYIHEPDNSKIHPTTLSQPSPEMPDLITKIRPIQFDKSKLGQPVIEDPLEISRQADESFNKQEYGRAADLYQRLLKLDPNDVDTYNNLGLTLHYLGRSTEALGKLNEGVGVDPTHQRIWLTLGFVNSQLGDIEQARTALTAAAKINADNDIGQSAVKMLENLP